MGRHSSLIFNTKATIATLLATWQIGILRCWQFGNFAGAKDCFVVIAGKTAM
jgi:hypothetical protein